MEVSYNPQHLTAVRSGVDGLKVWRSDNQGVKLLLAGAPLHKINLEGVDLSDADLRKADLHGAYLRGANLCGSDMSECNLVGAYLVGANLEDANLRGANLSSADLRGVLAKRTSFNGTNLEKSLLDSAHVNGALFRNSNLHDTSFRAAEITSALFEDCETNRNTNFSGSGLGAARILPPSQKSKLEYNIRRLDWEGQYRNIIKQWIFSRPTFSFVSPFGNPIEFLLYTLFGNLLLPLRLALWLLFGSSSAIYVALTWLFWQHSDYGNSTGRILFAFLIWNLIFTFLYVTLPEAEIIAPADDPSNYVVSIGIDMGSTDNYLFKSIRAFYFSVVTMSTLGTGEMVVNRLSILSHVIVVLNVLVGYLLLGALVTRLSISFTVVGRG